jgi:hypothetical protein
MSFVPMLVQLNAACPHLVRASTSYFLVGDKLVDGRAKSGHDE